MKKAFCTGTLAVSLLLGAARAADLFLNTDTATGFLLSGSVWTRYWLMAPVVILAWLAGLYVPRKQPCGLRPGAGVWMSGVNFVFVPLAFCSELYGFLTVLNVLFGTPEQAGPHQTAERWMENLAAAVALAPEHLSCYGLKVEEGTPLYAVRDSAGLPGDEEQADMYLQTVEFLKQYGYVQYEISNFAKPGFESRHNLKYWQLQEYAGFGPGAHSDFGGVRYAYEKDVESYIAAAHGGVFRFSENTVIPPRDRDVEWLMLGARTVYGLDPKDYENRFRRRFDPIFLPFLQKCAAAGYAVMEKGRWHLTPRGFLVSNQIIGGLLDAQAEEKQRRAEAAARGDFRVDSYQ